MRSEKMNAIGVYRFALAATLVLAGSSLPAETITGTINGHACAHADRTCPVDRLDPHIALERDFVLQTPKGAYFFLSNVPRDTKVRHALKKARVTGALDDRYNAVVVDELQIEENGVFRTVWTERAQYLEWSYLQGTDGLGPVVGHPFANP
jgi:hypothetical protein